jgi:hypothetical protein
MVPYICVDSYVIAYLQASIWHDVMAIISLDDFIVWLQTCEHKTSLFKYVMPMVMDNLTIV